MKENRRKGWIAVDLDGTLAFYEGWKGETHIGEPIPEMIERVKKWLSQGKTVKIFTARASNITDLSRAAIDKWSMTHIGQTLEITCQKDRWMEELWDDRSIRVLTNTGQLCCSNNSISEHIVEHLNKAQVKIWYINENEELTEGIPKSLSYRVHTLDLIKDFCYDLINAVFDLSMLDGKSGWINDVRVNLMYNENEDRFYAEFNSTRGKHLINQLIHALSNGDYTDVIVLK